MLDFFNWRRQQTDESVRHYQQQANVPADTPVQDCHFLVLDIETTGLHASKDHIVSMGWVSVMAQEIALESACHLLIKPPVSVGQSAVFHGLYDKDLTKAVELADALRLFLQAASGAVLVAHHARLEQSFLQTACQRCFGKSPRFKFLDTMQIEWQRLLQQNKVVNNEGLRLSACLTRHQLPTSTQHHALEDAYGAALLLLSQIKQTRTTSPQLADLWQLNTG